jgi:secondary thiamine-phosphate synthase enzyme
MGIRIERHQPQDTPGAVTPQLRPLSLNGQAAPPTAVVDVYHVHGELRVATMSLHYQTARGPQFIDTTEDVARAVAASCISEGVVVIYSRHTTAAIKINEHEPELLADMERIVSAVSPQERAYHHNDFRVRVVNMEEDECPNGHAHCQHLLLNTSESVPLRGGRLQLGPRQRIFLVELDRARPREVIVHTMGC